MHRHDAERRRLASAIRAEQAHYLSLADSKCVSTDCMQALASGITLMHVNGFHLIVVLLVSVCVSDTLLVLFDVSIWLMLLVRCLWLRIVCISERVDPVFVNYYREKKIDN